MSLTKNGKTDWDFFSELVELHNAVTFGEKEEKEFDKFVLENKEKFNNPEYLQIFAERMSPLPRYYDEHLEICQFFYGFMENNPDWENFNFNLRAFIRLKAFQDTFKKYLAEKKEN